MKGSTNIALVLGFAALVLAPHARGDGPNDKITPPSDLPNINVEEIMSAAVGNIAKRYNLNEDQTKKTDELMQQGVYRFLREHHKEVWPLLRELVSSQQIGKPPENPADAIRLGKLAQPILEAAMKAIYEDNAVWREWLTDDQKAMHDFDLTEMEKTFARMETNLESWVAVKPTSDPLFPPAVRYPNQPRRPRRPPPGIPVPKEDTLRLGMFEVRLDAFIKEYDLTPGQKNAARGILDDIKDQARDYRASKKQEFAKVAADLERALESSDIEAREKANESQRALLEASKNLFPVLDGRLNGLLETGQRERHANKGDGAGDAAKGDTPANVGRVTAKKAKTSARSGSAKGKTKKAKGAKDTKDKADSLPER